MDFRFLNDYGGTFEYGDDWDVAITVGDNLQYTSNDP